jgi:hypothetical protein
VYSRIVFCWRHVSSLPRCWLWSLSLEFINITVALNHSQHIFAWMSCHVLWFYIGFIMFFHVNVYYINYCMLSFLVLLFAGASLSNVKIIYLKNPLNQAKLAEWSCNFHVIYLLEENENNSYRVCILRGKNSALFFKLMRIWQLMICAKLF